MEADGYFVLKLIKTNKNGIPDVLALHPEYGIEFYEIKTKKGRVSKLQEYRLKELDNMDLPQRFTGDEHLLRNGRNIFLEDLE